MFREKQTFLLARKEVCIEHPNFVKFESKNTSATPVLISVEILPSVGRNYFESQTLFRELIKDKFSHRGLNIIQVKQASFIGGTFYHRACKVVSPLLPGEAPCAVS